VRVFHGLTPFRGKGYGAFVSRWTVLGGSAVFDAANALLAKIRAAAGARLACAAEKAGPVVRIRFPPAVSLVRTENRSLREVDDSGVGH
jgi:CO/xanthine dehydrogenase Mo-binding subunit